MHIAKFVSAILSSFIFIETLITISHATSTVEDLLLPYHGVHGSSHNHRYVRDCQHVKYKNVTHELYPADNHNISLPVETHYFRKQLGTFYNKKYVNGHLNIIHNPAYTISVLEPGGESGCSSHRRETVKNTSLLKSCIVATNAGFFNTHNGTCLGNVVTSGNVVENNDGIQNAHFGITEDKKLFFGYLSEYDMMGMNFLNLVGGVIWLVRKGESYVDASLKVECSDTEETGTLQRFVNVVSARTAVGHDKQGRVIMVNVDGKTGVNGVNLHEFAQLLIEFGVINAVNLDGGGSATMVINRTVVNYPSDECKQHPFICERKVSTVLCAHSHACSNPKCSRNGDCINGKCHCHRFWSGPECSVLNCPNNCFKNGLCTKDGCMCHNGWIGEHCDKPCPDGFYGQGCKSKCLCKHGICSLKNGSCQCHPGYIGLVCNEVCPVGTYGDGCQNFCQCEGCFCDNVNGTCSSATSHITIQKTASCLAHSIIKKQNLVKAQPEQNRLWMIGLIFACAIAAGSILLNISLLCMHYNQRSSFHGRHNYKYIPQPAASRIVIESVADSDSSYDLSDATSEELFTPLKTNTTSNFYASSAARPS